MIARVLRCAEREDMSWRSILVGILMLGACVAAIELLANTLTHVATK